MIGRVHLSILCTAFVVADTGAAESAEGSTGKPLNFVVVVADDLGWSDLACYGADLHQTQRLDGLAAAGLQFTNAYAAAPICSPTRAALMTGKYPARLHMTIWYEAAANPPQDRRLVPPATLPNLPHSETTLAEVLRDAGYATVHVGKWHLGDAAYYPENHGFDVNVGGTMWGAPPTYFAPYRGPFGQRGELRYVPRLEGAPPGEYLTDRLTDEALRQLEQLGDRPFLLYMAYHSVHTPIEAKPEIVERYRRRLQPGMRHGNPVFAAMVHSLDENVGRILDWIDQRQLADETVVIFTSDNGGFINSHRQMPMVTNNAPLRSGKGSLYEGGVRVPLIVRWPGRTRPSTVCDEPVISMDLFATIAAAVAGNGAAPAAIAEDGLSLLPLLSTPDAALDRQNLYFHYPHYYATTTPVGAVRSGEWKLLEYFETGRVELYRLADDVGETNDLAEQNPQIRDALVQQLHTWRESVQAQMPQPNADYSRDGE